MEKNFTVSQVVKIFFVVILLAACTSRLKDQVPTPLSILAVTQQPTNTFIPTSTRLSSTPTPTLTATLLPTLTTTIINRPTSVPTATPLPTYVIEKPMHDPGMYHLADWNQQKAFDTVSILDQEWNRIKREISFIYAQTGIDSLKSAVALTAQEAILRYPDVTFRQDMEWKIALDLATAGQQEATQHLALLLQTALNQQPALIMDSFYQLGDKGFTFDLKEASSLFNGQPDWWIVIVHKAESERDWDGAGGGAVLSIQKDSEGAFVVKPVGGYWISYWGSTFEVLYNPPSAGRNPEISILQSSSHGSPITLMSESWLCTYQMNDDLWMPVLTNTNSEPGGTVGNDIPLHRFCFVTYGFMQDVQYIPGNNQPSDTLQASDAIDPLDCRWSIDYSFKWKNGEYQQQAVVNDMTQSHDAYDLSCLFRVWDLGDTIQNKQEVLAYMEKVLAARTEWITLLEKNDDNWAAHNALALLTDYRFYQELLFQIGRFYALSGNTQAAHDRLAQFNKNSSQYNGKWRYIANHYLANIKDLNKAEEGLARNLSSPCSYCGQPWPDKPVFDRAMSELTRTGALDEIDKEIGPLIKETCVYELNYDCAELIYIHALANQIKGNEREAITSYWLVWRNYPKSLYALAAQEKLEQREER
jgi:hypothetical protein